MRVGIALIFASLLSGMTGAVTIVRLEVPQVVEADTTPVVLDCDFQVNEWERSGLVLKWYVDEVQLVYQWIPPRVPQVLGVLAGRVNTTFTASAEPWSAHRAIYISRPHPLLSGQYSCTVSTFEDEDRRSARLLVWRAPKQVDLEYWRPSEHLVNITCLAAGAAPRPEFTLFTSDPNGTRQEVSVRGRSGRRVEGLWEAGAWGLIAWAETTPETVVGCTVSLPGTSQTHTTTRVYYPDLPIITTTTTTTTTEAATVKGESPRHWDNGSHGSPGAATSFFASSGRSVLQSPARCRNCPIVAAAVWASLWWAAVTQS